MAHIIVCAGYLIRYSATNLVMTPGSVLSASRVLAHMVARLIPASRMEAGACGRDVMAEAARAANCSAVDAALAVLASAAALSAAAVDPTSFWMGGGGTAPSSAAGLAGVLVAAGRGASLAAAGFRSATDASVESMRRA